MISTLLATSAKVYLRKRRVRAGFWLAEIDSCWIITENATPRSLTYFTSYDLQYRLTGFFAANRAAVGGVSYGDALAAIQADAVSKVKRNAPMCMLRCNVTRLI